MEREIAGDVPPQPHSQKLQIEVWEEVRTPQKVLSDVRGLVNSEYFVSSFKEYNESPKISDAEKETKFIEWNTLRLELQRYIPQVRDLKVNWLDSGEIKRGLEELERKIKTFISGIQKINQGR